MRELALFAGAGGGILASHLLGWRTVCAVEIDDYARSVLLARQNDGILRPFPVWDDITTFDGKPWRGSVDVVSGGFPCQAFSTAARGRNVAQNFWPDMRRVIFEVSPQFVFAENVTQGAINAAADDLEQMGYQTKAVSLSAKNLGADHVRGRHWLFAYADIKSKLRIARHAEMAISKIVCCSVWSAEPEQSRMADGLANRVDRLRAIGNGQVPVVAAAAWIYLASQ
jgi:DNA (cytosine-5)-methyltransferase 1